MFLPREAGVGTLRSDGNDAVVVEPKTPDQFRGIIVVATSVGSNKVTIALFCSSG
jgi:hypothetical protein